MPVAIDIDEAEVGIVPLEVGRRRQWREAVPISVFGALEKAGHRPLENDAVELAVAGEVEELGPGGFGFGKAGKAGDL